MLGKEIFDLWMGHVFCYDSKTIRPAVLERMDLTLASFPRTKEPHPTRRISERVMKRLVKEYEATYWGKTVAPEAVAWASRALLGHRQWWTMWTLASFLEHLLRTGHEVKVV